MGKGKDRVKSAPAEIEREKDRVKAEPAEIEREVEQIRGQMEPVIEELDHRRHALMDMGSRIRRRAPKVLGVLALVAGGVAVVRMMKRRGH